MGTVAVSEALTRWVVVTALVVPWLWPIAVGPSPAVVPWLASLACAATVSLIGSWRRLGLADAVPLAWLVAALASSVIGLMQYYGATAGLGALVNVTPMGEAFANLRQRNQFATLTNIGLVTLLWGPLAYGNTPTVPHRGRSSSGVDGWHWQLAGAMLLVFGNAASGSRTGLLQLLSLLVLAVLWKGAHGRRIWLLLVTALLVYAVASFVLPASIGLDPMSKGVTGRFRDDGMRCGSRLVMWSNVVDLIAQKPIFGWGWNELDFAHFMTLYPGPRFCEILDNAHNLPLHLAVELGLPVALLICGLGAWLVWYNRPWRETDPARRMAWAAIGIILLHSMLEYPLWYGPFQIAAGLCICLLWSTRAVPPAVGRGETLQPMDAAGSTRSPARIGTAVAGVIALLCVAYAAWDYHRISQIYLPVSMRGPAYREETLAKIQASWLFRNQVRFAELTTTDLSRDNAGYLNAMAHDLLHFSPEARVAEKVIESAVMLGRDDEALYYLARYRAAFPVEHTRWAKARAAPVDGSAPVN